MTKEELASLIDEIEDSLTSEDYLEAPDKLVKKVDQAIDALTSKKDFEGVHLLNCVSLYMQRERLEKGVYASYFKKSIPTFNSDEISKALRLLSSNLRDSV